MWSIRLRLELRLYNIMIYIIIVTISVSLTCKIQVFRCKGIVEKFEGDLRKRVLYIVEQLQNA